MPKALPTFMGSSNSVGLGRALSDNGVSGNSKLVIITGSTYEITQYLSFYTRLIRNSTGFTTFSGSSHTAVSFFQEQSSQ